MKKNHLICLTMMLTASLLITGTAFAAKKNSTPPAAVNVTMEQACKIVVEHAGFKETDVNFVKVKLEQEARGAEYEIEFYQGNTEYDYTIHADTGEILEFDSEVEFAPNTVTATGVIPSEDAVIGEDAAKVNAFAHAGVSESDVTKLKVDFEWEDGKPEYEIKFRAGGAKYNYDVDALNGKITGYKVDRE